MLLPSQRQAIYKLHPLKVGALFKRPGTGKSRTAIELIKYTPGVDYVLWLAPYRSVNPLIPGTGIKDEVSKWLDLDIEIDFVGIETLSNSTKVYLDTMEKLKDKTAYIVCDESLKIKNHDAIRTKRILSLSKLAEYKMILNGTPISRNLLDIWSQMEFLSPLILKMGQREFEDTFCEWVKIRKTCGPTRMEKKLIKKYHNIDYLYSLIRPYVYEADLQLELGMQHIHMPYTLDESSKIEYEYLKNKYLDNDMMEMRNNNIFLEMTMKMQHVYCCTNDKFTVAENIIKAHGAKNIVIFCKFISSREECSRRFPGTTVLSIQSDSMSLNLQDKYVTIEFDKTWDWALVDQYRHRTYRIGQKHDCYYYYLDGNIKLDALIKLNNERKMDQLEYFKNITKEQINEDI